MMRRAYDWRQAIGVKRKPWLVMLRSSNWLFLTMGDAHQERRNPNGVNEWSSICGS